MKPTCPIQKCTMHGVEYANSTALFRHLMNDHTDHEVTSYLVGLLFNMYEKIKEYDIADPEEMMVADVLKSLVEKKK